MTTQGSWYSDQGGVPVVKPTQNQRRDQRLYSIVRDANIVLDEGHGYTKVSRILLQEIWQPYFRGLHVARAVGHT